ncbi:MFS transporter [Aaosphaeria arxii CBS 175.79]|uniref:MFS transporter n=1 Tax=Aaosphaeria arxii CBS 175.79 TaxID=1450172 RepID=A0A6A5XID3_9PLEO|nr:MFS transporter [Aaosphaeria arxii CBS 175.79]KAF2013008.1 MFS transporter [Aaosphaeria arxii CBS 175.79]
MQVDDTNHPFNFSTTRKRLIFVAGLLCAFNSTLGSSLPSGATVSLSLYFGIAKDSISIVLLNSLYMVGFAISPLFFGPLSEAIGRRPVLIGNYTLYTIFTLCCAVSWSYNALLVFRLLAGMSAAVPNAVIAGLYADIFAGHKERGRAMAAFMVVSAQGPLIGPLVSGFLSVNLGWRWTFWIGLMIAGVGLPVVWLLPETYVPVLEERMKERRKGNGLLHAISCEDFVHVFTTLKRPGLMIVTEPILLLSSLYLSLIYAMMYLFFQVYPIVFGGIYGLSQDKVGLAYIPIMAGVLIAFAAFYVFGEICVKAERRQRSWTQVQEFRRLPLACFGALCIPIALLFMAFTANINIPPAVPMVFCGIFFGTGYSSIFLAMLIYLSDIYKRYAASAQAAASTTRSIFAVCLPFAAPVMYHNLGVKFASITLACISGVMAFIPFLFLFYRGKLHASSIYAG